jgi:predicted XRE-type DNA-binding protein
MVARRGYPSSKKLRDMDEKLKNIEGSFALPKDATYVGRLKFDLCKRIIAFVRTHRITQVELAGKLGIDPARVSEITNYKIDKFTIDTLLTYNRSLDPSLEMKIKQAV